MFHRILVAIDSNNARHQAVRAAGEIARMTGVALRIVHVAAAAVTPQSFVELEDNTTAQGILDEAVAAARAAGVQADGELLSGVLPQVPAELSQAAQRFGADLIVLSHHHRGPLEALFSPRVSDAIAHTGKTAVLLLPQEEES